MPRQDTPFWRQCFGCTVLAAYFYVFMEWLFFITKPSFMTPLGSWERVGIFFGTAPLVALPASLALSSLWALAWALPGSIRHSAWCRLGFAVPAAVLACCLFLLIDNFTFTIFDFGVLTARRIQRFPYALLIVGLWAWILRKLVRARISRAVERGLVWAAVVCVLCSVLSWISQFVASESEAAAIRTHGPLTDSMPHILLLGSDGVEAKHMSVYGYERDTTPFLRSRIETALFAENSYPNVTRTGGALASMLTGKLATHTYVYGQFGILKGRDTFEHLPGILRDAGYRSIHVSARLFADSSAVRRPWNMHNAFDDFEHFAALPLALAVPFSSDVYFLGQMVDRIDSRLLHAVGFETAESALAEVVHAKDVTDEQRIKAVLDFTEESDRPTFAHLHLMGTHRPYQFRKRFFTGGKARTERRLDDYDSAIRTFDEHVEGIVDRLRQTGRLDNTIIVLTSDHGRGWSHRRIPLMFFFPNGDHHGVIGSNVQLLDVAPTLLDYIGLPIPEWMEGESLLGGALDPRRPILSVQTIPLQPPPFAYIGRVGATICNRTTWLDPRTGKVDEEFVQRHTQPCDPVTLPAPELLRAMLISDLESSGYDVTSLLTKGSDSADGWKADRIRESR